MSTLASWECAGNGQYTHTPVEYRDTLEGALGCPLCKHAAKLRAMRVTEEKKGPRLVTEDVEESL